MNFKFSDEHSIEVSELSTEGQMKAAARFAVTLDDELVFAVRGTMSTGSYATYNDPSENGEIEDISYLLDGQDISDLLSDDQRAKIDDLMLERHMKSLGELRAEYDDYRADCARDD